MLVKVLSFFALVASAAVAAPHESRSLPTGTVTCGSDRYSVSAIEAAINAGVDDMNEGNFPGMRHSITLSVIERTYRILPRR